MTKAALLDEAQRLDARAEELMQDVRGLRMEAARLRLEATQDERRVTVRGGNGNGKGDLSVQALGRLVDAVEAVQPASLKAIADHLGVSDARARAMCVAAEEMGLVQHSGAGKTKRWRSGGEVREPEPESPEAVMRSTMVKLDTFILSEIAVQAGVDEETALHWLGVFEERGWLQREDVDGTDLFEYLTPERQKNQARRRSTPAEVAVVDRRVSGVATTPRRRMVAGSRARKLVKDLQDAGAEIITAGAGKHHKVVMDGQVVGGLAKNMSWDGDVKAAREAFRKKGVKV